MADPQTSLIRDKGVATVLLGSPILARRVLVAINEIFDALSLEPSPPPVVLASAHPTIFLAGAHLAEIEALDQYSCVGYAELGRSVARRLASHPNAVVAAVHGSCSGGGFDFVMACDWVIASPTATFSHPGVRRGLVTGWGGTTSVGWASEPQRPAGPFSRGRCWTRPLWRSWGLCRASPRIRSRRRSRPLADWPFFIPLDCRSGDSSEARTSLTDSAPSW